MSNRDVTFVFLGLVISSVALFATRKTAVFLKQNVGKILDALFWTATRYVSGAIATKMSLRHYCRTQLAKDETKYLRVPGRPETPLLTDRTFVTLRLDNLTRTISNDLDELWVDGENRVQIVGDPGSGKSSLVKRLFRKECQKALDGEQDVRLPILVELKDFTPPQAARSPKATADWAIKHIRERVTAISGYDMGSLFDSSLKNGGLLLLLDGLDEVKGSVYPHALRTINALNARLSNEGSRTRVVLTMRIQYHRQIWEDLTQTFAQVYTVQPFTSSDIYKFLSLWPFKHASKAGQKVSDRIYADLSDRPTLREMCTNPLILAMYVQSDQNGDHPAVTETRTEFYSDVVKELIIDRRGRQIEITNRKNLRKTREEILGKIAFDNLTDFDQSANAVSWDRAIEITRTVCQITDHAEAASILREICKETGLLSEERREETLRFVHLTFCEFLAAKEANDGDADGWTTVFSLHRKYLKEGSHLRSRLVEMIPFMIGMMPRYRVHDAMIDTASLHDSLLLGRAFLETQAYDHTSWKDYSMNEAKHLSETSEEYWDEEWLRRLHLFNVVLVDEASWRLQHSSTAGEVSLEALFSKLVQNNKSRLIRLFGSYASVDPQAAFRLARACGLNLITDEPMLVAANLASLPLYSMVKQSISDDPRLLTPGALIMFEAALASPAVCALAWQDSPESLGNKIALAQIDKKNRWGFPSLSHPLRASLLTYVASVATSADEEIVLHFPRVNLAKTMVKPPGSFRALSFGAHPFFLPVAMMAFFLVALSLTIFIQPPPPGSVDSVVSIVIPIPLSLLLLAFMHAAGYPLSVARQYRRFLNGIHSRVGGFGLIVDLGRLFSWRTARQLNNTLDEILSQGSIDSELGHRIQK